MPRIDDFRLTQNASLGARRLRAVTPNDGVDLPLGVCDRIWVGGAGNINLICEDDTTQVLMSGFTAGSMHLLRAKRIFATNTTATLIVACYGAP